MSDKYDERDRSKNGFFSNREIWEQVFGKNGREGAINELDNKIDNSFSELESMVCEEFEKLGKKLDEYNGLREKTYELNDATADIENKQKEQADICKKQMQILKDKDFKESTTDETFEKGKKEAFREVKQFIAIIAVALTALEGVVAMLGLFVF